MIAAEVHTSIMTEKSQAELRKIQLDDGPVGFILKAVETGQRPTSDDVRGHGPDAQRLNQLWSKLLLENGGKYVDVNNTSYLQLVTPRAMQEEILQEIHAGELLECRKMLKDGAALVKLVPHGKPHRKRTAHLYRQSKPGIPCKL